MQSIKDLLTTSIDKIDTAVTALYNVVTGFRTPYVINITSTTMDYTSVNILSDTIIVTGALTGNTTLIIGNAIRKYNIINNCTGAYYITIKTASGTGYDSYSNDRLVLVCDGTNILLTAWNENLIVGVERLSPEYWRGYPLYKKAYPAIAMATGSGNGQPHGISGAFTVKHIYGTLKTPVGYYTLPHAQPVGIQYCISLGIINSDIITMTVSSGDVTGCTAYISIEYIKV